MIRFNVVEKAFQTKPMEVSVYSTGRKCSSIFLAQFMQSWLMQWITEQLLTELLQMKLRQA